MAGYRGPIILVFFITCDLIVTKIIAQHCGKAESSQYGKMLRGHVFKTVKTAGRPWECMRECNAENKCQSINFVISTGKCELNKRTMQARPEDLVGDKDRLYMKRFSKRGKWRIKCASVSGWGLLSKEPPNQYQLLRKQYWVKCVVYNVLQLH